MERPNETIADIIAWLRKPREGENAYLTLWRDEIADRLEAAHKRESDNLATLREAIDYLCERMADMDATFDPSEVGCLRAALAAPATTAKSSAVGNAAKLREALCEILSYIESFHKYITPGKGKKLTALFAVADTISNKARAALSAPPRNCDRFASAEEAWDAYDAWVESRRAKGQTPAFNEFGWLFAPATEKKEGNK